MRAYFVVLALGFLLFASSIRAQHCPVTGVKADYWSRLSLVVCEDESAGQMHLEAVSPDKQKSILVKGQHLDGKFFLKSNKDAKLEELQPALVGAEVLWSLDSKGLAITTCFGGSGPCVVWTSLDDKRQTPTEIAKAAFSTDHKTDACYTNANVGALTWEQGSENIVLVVEVPPSPQCVGHNEGYFEAFLISLSERKVVSQFNMQETVRRWNKILGTGLRNDIELVREDARSKHK